MPKVFISYSHDNDIHKRRVQELSDRLRREGVDCVIDVYETSPPEGWPNWMHRQVTTADYVLVVFTETYKRRVLGNEVPGVGLGAAWEGMVITQSIYNTRGTNIKFIPVVFDCNDLPHIVEYLGATSRYDVSDESQYTELYRHITQQPAVTRPLLGSIRNLPPASPSTTNSCGEASEIPTSIFREDNTPCITWLLPRGFILFEDIVHKIGNDFSPTAHYYSYRGEWFGSTHYHKSYDWVRWERGVNPLETQSFKLHVPISDHSYSYTPLIFLEKIGKEFVTITAAGEIDDASELDKSIAVLHSPGTICLPKPPSIYRPLAVSGRLRDLKKAAENEKSAFEKGKSVSEYDTLRTIRREVRLESHRLLSSQHVALINLDEVLNGYNRLQPDESVQWLEELIGALAQTIDCITEQTT